MRVPYRIAGAILLGLLSPLAAAADTPVLTAVSGVQAGLWQLRTSSEPGSAPREMCVPDPRRLVQLLRHGNAACGTFVIANEAKLSTVHYSCPGNGWGRTSLRLVSPTLIHIDSQGIADKAPFAFSVEGRRLGDCTSSAAPVAANAPASR